MTNTRTRFTVMRGTLYLLSHSLDTFAQLVHHVAHLQGFVGAEVGEVVVVSHAPVEVPQWVPPRHQELQNHLGQLLSLRERNTTGQVQTGAVL